MKGGEQEVVGARRRGMGDSPAGRRLGRQTGEEGDQGGRADLERWKGGRVRRLSRKGEDERGGMKDWDGCGE